jgi:GNAT superfamily N-acetyltransferase
MRSEMNNDVSYRLAREDDLSAMRLIQSKALYDLIVTRSGRPPSAIAITDEPSSEMRHLLRTDSKLAWLAMEHGRAIGFSVGFVRKELWFLSDLFMLPEAYGRGIGGELLRRCVGAGEARGARIRAVASSHDLSAQKLYIGAGMVPQFPLYGVVGAARDLRDLRNLNDRAKWRAESKSVIKPVAASRTSLRKLGDLDATIWGRRRDVDHRFWLGEAGSKCLAVTAAKGAVVAYAYYSTESGRIGPVAATTTRQQLSLLRAIGDALAGQNDMTVEFRVPGINMTVLSALLRAGFQIDHHGFYMTSRSFGRFDRYLPSGGTLL